MNQMLHQRIQFIQLFISTLPLKLTTHSYFLFGLVLILLNSFSYVFAASCHIETEKDKQGSPRGRVMRGRCSVQVIDVCVTWGRSAGPL